jgi:hypothetical protein
VQRLGGKCLVAQEIVHMLSASALPLADERRSMKSCVFLKKEVGIGKGHEKIQGSKSAYIFRTHLVVFGLADLPKTRGNILEALVPQ